MLRFHKENKSFRQHVGTKLKSTFKVFHFTVLFVSLVWCLKWSHNFTNSTCFWPSFDPIHCSCFWPDLWPFWPFVHWSVVRLCLTGLKSAKKKRPDVEIWTQRLEFKTMNRLFLSRFQTDFFFVVSEFWKLLLFSSLTVKWRFLVLDKIFQIILCDAELLSLIN